MDKIINLLELAGFISKGENIFHKIEQSHVLEVKLHELDQKYIHIFCQWIYDGVKFKVFELTKLKKTHFPNIIGRLLVAKPDDNNLYHCEIYCWQCEKMIDQQVNNKRFSSINGFVDTHHTEGGRCVRMIGLISAQNVMDILRRMRFCEKCTVVLSHQNAEIQ